MRKKFVIESCGDNHLNAHPNKDKNDWTRG